MKDELLESLRFAYSWLMNETKWQDEKKSNQLKKHAGNIQKIGIAIKNNQKI